MASRQTRSAFLHLLSEIFFAVLPLIVIGLVWSKDYHPTSFWLGPEISMTSCILYGLALSKLMMGAGVAKSASGTPQIQEQASNVYVALSLVPVLGVILSVIAITKVLGANAQIGWLFFQYLNLGISIAVFLVIGGYGVNKSYKAEI